MALGQEVFGMEAEGLLSDALILQHRGHFGDEWRDLEGNTCRERGLGWGH